MSNEPDIHAKDLFGDAVKPKPRGPLMERFLIPPFSVLNARDGAWQDRKRAWLSIGLRSELGRGEDLQPMVAKDLGDNLNGYRAAKASPGGSLMPAADYSKGERGNGRGHPVPGGGSGKNSCWLHKQPEGGFLDNTGVVAGEENGSGTSIFDPVLCELAYRWFCPEGGQIIDPFAGGSVRGVVASLMGRRYWGCDLRAEQIAANYEQAEILCPDIKPVWDTGCSRQRLQYAPEADLLMSCPPYGDLECYSDDEFDLSNMDFEDFVIAYEEIIARACMRLKPNRFAVFVVGDYRDKKTGMYRNFPGKTIEAFAYAGLQLYNECILVTSVGSLPVRITKQFDGGRKLGKTHQNVLVFCKGDWKKAAAAINESAQNEPKINEQ